MPGSGPSPGTSTHPGLYFDGSPVVGEHWPGPCCGAQGGEQVAVTWCDRTWGLHQAIVAISLEEIAD